MRNAPLHPPAIRFATFLSPILYGTYEYIARYVGEKIGCPTVMSVGQSWEQFAKGQVDIGFICGLPYVQMTGQSSCPIELLAAPVLEGKRYQGKPIYFSDVLVRKESLYTSFADLRGCTWAYNQKTSHSGWNVVCYSLLERGQTPHYFGATIETGSHLRSVQMVLEGRADATAVDSHVLDVLLSRERELAAKLRVIAMLGPSTIPPVVVAKKLDSDLKRRIHEVLVAMHQNPRAASELHDGLIDRFVPVTDVYYQDIRNMLALALEFTLK